MWIACLRKIWPHQPLLMQARDDHEDALLWVVRFQAGAFACAVEACHVRALHTHSPQSTPVERLLNLPEAPSTDTRRTLLIRQQAQTYALEVSEPVVLTPLAVQSISPLPALIARYMQIKALQGLVLDEAGPCLLLDPQTLAIHDACLLIKNV